MNMKIRSVFSCLVISALSMLAVRAADKLEGRAVLPAATFAQGPTSGRQLGTNPINGQPAPFLNKQPVQGFSAIQDNGDGTFNVMPIMASAPSRIRVKVADHVQRYVAKYCLKEGALWDVQINDRNVWLQQQLLIGGAGVKGEQ